MEAGCCDVNAMGWDALARASIGALEWGPARPVVAQGFFDRLLGMAKLPARAPDGVVYVLAFPRCRAVHTCFMRRRLDIAFIAGDGTVLSHAEDVGPGRFLRESAAVMVLERFSGES